MTQHAGVEIFHLLFRLLACDLAWVINEQPNDLGVVDVAIPKFLGKLRIAADLFCKLPQLSQSDSKAL